MGQKELYILIIISIWAISLAITGILAWVYHNKIKGLKTIRQEYDNQIKQAEALFKLEPKKIKYQLPQDQVCYYFSEADLYLKKLKKNNKPSKVDYKFIYKHKKIVKEEGQIYLTNKYLLVEYGNIQIKEKISDIISLYQFTFFNGVKWIKGIEILLNKLRILIHVENIEILFAYKAIRGEQK